MLTAEENHIIILNILQFSIIVIDNNLFSGIKIKCGHIITEITEASYEMEHFNNDKINCVTHFNVEINKLQYITSVSNVWDLLPC